MRRPGKPNPLTSQLLCIRRAGTNFWMVFRAWLLAALFLGAAASGMGCAGNGSDEESSVNSQSFIGPEQCANCHPRQYAEWQGSMMAYGAISPVFNALEAAGNSMTGGAFAADGESALFCQGCHAPISVALQEYPTYAEAGGRPSRDFLGEVGRHGLSCDFCHQVAHADFDASPLGDGIANASFVLRPGQTKYGPFEDPVTTPFHEVQQSDYLRSSQFCGSCHDVRLPPTDMVTQEPFLRLENLFTEWEQGPYATAANPHGRVVTCQDCHMSAYPYSPPGTYFMDRASSYGDAPVRSVSTHYFTGVDIAFIDFPGQAPQGVDSHGLPIGQQERRRDLLRAACTIEIAVDDAAAAPGVVPITVGVTNVGAGHNVPSGFSQEREIWIELIVTDADGEVVYESGYVVDRAHPETGENALDGRLNDEDLEEFHAEIDPLTMEAEIEIGPDHNQRPARNLGLRNFGNEFRRIGIERDDEVLSPFLANHMDNTHSIPPLETIWTRYDVPVAESARGPLHIAARLRFRAFPPHFLRTLARARPDLVDEALIDRNRIVDMAEAEISVETRP